MPVYFCIFNLNILVSFRTILKFNFLNLYFLLRALGLEPKSSSKVPRFTADRIGTLWVNKVPIYWFPYRISVSQSCFTALTAPNFDLYELRIQFHQVQEIVYIFALIPLMLTCIFSHGVILWNRRLLKSFLGLYENPNDIVVWSTSILSSLKQNFRIVVWSTLPDLNRSPAVRSHFSYWRIYLHCIWKIFVKVKLEL